MVRSLCSIRVIDFCNRCFDTWLGVANSFYWFIIAGHLSLDCGALVETFKLTADNNIEYSSRSLASNNSPWFLNSDFDNNQIWYGNRRISLKTSVELMIQKFYFLFLFVRIFLIGSLSSSFATIITEVYHGFDSVPKMLATNIPKTSNDFFSYFMLKAFSINDDNLLQCVNLTRRINIRFAYNHTPRQKWAHRNRSLEYQWSTIFPFYTNLACIDIASAFFSI